MFRNTNKCVAITFLYNPITVFEYLQRSYRCGAPVLVKITFVEYIYQLICCGGSIYKSIRYDPYSEVLPYKITCTSPLPP